MNRLNATRRLPTTPQEKPSKILRLTEPSFLAAALLLHAVLAVAMRFASPVSKLHAVVTLLVGIWAAVFSRKPEHAAYAAGYVAACEVLWRMTRGTLVWEHGKYALLTILLLAMIRFRKAGQPIAQQRRLRHVWWTPVLRQRFKLCAVMRDEQ